MNKKMKPFNKNKPYEQFSAEELILRDWLAIDRTTLANTRTFLSYIRTSLTFLVAGISAFHFIDVLWIKLVGICCCLFSLLLFSFGVGLYLRQKNKLKVLIENRE